MVDTVSVKKILDTQSDYIDELESKVRNLLRTMKKKGTDQRKPPPQLAPAAAVVRKRAPPLPSPKIVSAQANYIHELEGINSKLFRQLKKADRKTQAAPPLPAHGARVGSSANGPGQSAGGMNAGGRAAATSPVTPISALASSSSQGLQEPAAMKPAAMKPAAKPVVRQLLPRAAASAARGGSFAEGKTAEAAAAVALPAPVADLRLTPATPQSQSLSLSRPRAKLLTRTTPRADLVLTPSGSSSEAVRRIKTHYQRLFEQQHRSADSAKKAALIEQQKRFDVASAAEAIKAQRRTDEAVRTAVKRTHKELEQAFVGRQAAEREKARAAVAAEAQAMAQMTEDTAGAVERARADEQAKVHAEMEETMTSHVGELCKLEEQHADQIDFFRSSQMAAEAELQREADIQISAALQGAAERAKEEVQAEREAGLFAAAKASARAAAEHDEALREVARVADAQQAAALDALRAQEAAAAQLQREQAEKERFQMQQNAQSALAAAVDDCERHAQERQVAALDEKNRMFDAALTQMEQQAQAAALRAQQAAREELMQSVQLAVAQERSNAAARQQQALQQAQATWGQEKAALLQEAEHQAEAHAKSMDLLRENCTATSAQHAQRVLLTLQQQHSLFQRDVQAAVQQLQESDQEVARQQFDAIATARGQ